MTLAVSRLTTMSREVPMQWDRSNRSHICIVYTPCDCSRRPSQWSPDTWDIPVGKITLLGLNNN